MGADIGADARAADIFDRAIRLMPQGSGSAIAEALSRATGQPISVTQIARARRGEAPISAGLLLCAMELAGMQQRLVLTDPEPDALPPRHPRRPRLRVIPGGLAAFLVLALATFTMMWFFAPRDITFLTDGHVVPPTHAATPKPTPKPTTSPSPSSSTLTPDPSPTAHAGSAATNPTPTPAPGSNSNPQPAPTPNPGYPAPVPTPAIPVPTPALPPLPLPTVLPTICVQGLICA